ncbi:MAG: hypothetical protein Q4G27_05725 [Flavobacteriaceae bacterium]|nr:hypothetical protein [Flavobacteriaceae bacterium]
MIQFYKTRDFGELISVTFDFVQKYGRNYFKNFFIINGIFLILILIIFWFGFGEILTQIFGSNLDGQDFFFEQYFTENQGVLIFAGIVVAILFLLLSFVNYSFPVLYLKRMAETGETQISSHQMIEDIKAHALRFITYFLAVLFILLPIFILVGVFSAMLMMILIGFLIIIFAMPVIMNIVNFTLFHHYNSSTGIFEAIKYAFNIQFSKSFWKYWGSTIMIYLIINVVSSILTFIPIFFVFGAAYANPAGFNPEEGSFYSILVIVIYLLSFLLGVILINLIYINTGFMYYDSRKDLHRNIQFSEIESIGKSEI